MEASSRRCLDFIATLQDPEQLPAARDAWQRLQRLRQAAYEETWSHAVLSALELEEYRNAQDGDAWLCAALGIEPPQLMRALKVLERTGQVAQSDRHWVTLPTAVTTGRDPALLGVLTRAWTQVALSRLDQATPGHFGYSLFAVSREDLRRLRDLQLEYLREMQAIIARSTPNECVGLLCLHLLDLRQGSGNALSD